MPHPIRRPALAACLVLALGLAACGGGSAPNSTTASATAGAGAPGARFAATRQCLAKNGVNLPQRPGGQRRPPGTGGPGGGSGGGGGGGIFGGGGAAGGGGGGGGGRPGRRLPAGVTRAQFQAALAKCGGGPGGRRAARGPVTPTVKAALVKFAACMRQSGIALPAPNTTGTGPVFSTAGLDTTTPKFAAARARCTPLLPAGFGRRPAGPPPVGAATTGGA